MRFIKRAMNHFKFVHPKLFVLLCIFFLNVIILFLYAIIISAIESVNYGTALLYVFTMALMPDKLFPLGANADVVERSHVWQLILMVTETLLLSGTLIGVASNTINDHIESGELARGKLDFKNHIVILQWSKIGADLIYDLSQSDERIDVIILSSKDPDLIRNSIESKFQTVARNKKNKPSASQDFVDTIETGFRGGTNKMHSQLRYFIKQGSAFSGADLEDCSIDQAKAVAVLIDDRGETTDDFVEDDMTDRDIRSLKILTLMADVIRDENPDLSIVVEVDTETTVKKMNAMISRSPFLSSKKISTFSYNSCLGEIIAKTLEDRRYSILFNELLSFEGSEFYAIKPEKKDGQALCQNDLACAIASKSQCLPIICYDDDANGTYDEIYAIAREKKYTTSRYDRKTPLKTERRFKMYANPVPEDDEEVFVVLIGESRKSITAKAELESFAKYKKDNYHVEVRPFTNDIPSIVEEFKDRPGRTEILILSDESADEDSVDANVFISLLNLAASKPQEGVEVHAEILDPSNQQSVNNLGLSKENIVISNRYVSLLISQLLTHPDSRRFYQDLFTANTEENNGVFDIDIVKAKEIIDFEGQSELRFPTRGEFVSSFYLSSGGSYSFLGVFEGLKPIFFDRDLDEEREVIITPETPMVITVNS